MPDDWVLAAVRQYERPLLAYVRKLFGDEDRGRDVVQDAFVQLLKQDRAAVEARVGPWLFAVSRRRVIDILRKENRMVALHDSPLTTDTGPAEAAETKDGAAAILSRLSTLPPQQHEAVRLKFQSQFSYREIGDVMGLSESHVGVLLHQALKTLRTHFSGERPV
jgi:RNA polymerase sigma factor (sigma-70 family)